MREMKDSGVRWGDKIPRGWKVQRLKYLCRFSKGLPITKADLKTSGKAVISYGQVHAKFNTGTAIDERLIRYVDEKYIRRCPQSICHKNDFIFADTSEDYEGAGNCVFVNTDNFVFAGYHTFIASPINYNGNPKFLAYLFQSDIWRKQIRSKVSGIKVYSITQIIMKNIDVIYPQELDCQNKIVDFLDAKCADIDSLTADIQKQINILKEYKKSVITQAVTKGLDPNVEMKDSGVGWIGMIPSKWNIGKIKSYVDKVGSGKTPKGDNTLYTKGKILFLRSQNVYNTGIILDDPPTVITDAIDKELSNTRVITDDVLLNITGGSIGRCCIYNLEKKANVNQHVSIIRMKKDKMLSGYMHYFWISDLGQTAINLYQTGGNREGMSASAIKNTPIPFMSIWEQQAIIDFLDSKCADIDAIISGKQKQLDVLKEYKKSLIYEYVTGKKEVPCHE